MPIVVSGVKMEGREVELPGCEDCGRSDGSEERQRFADVVARPIFEESAVEEKVIEENKTCGQAGERECAPGKDGEKPRLGSAQIVASVDVGLQRPRQPGWAPGGVEGRS